MSCYITRTASYLPGPAVENDEIERFIGSLDGEAATKEKILSMNGIVRRHYAQDHLQQKTHDVYGLAARAAQQCLSDYKEADSITYLAAGTTYTPLAAPGFASILHHRLQADGYLNYPVEISSHAGICSSAANAMVAAIRSISAGHHRSALCVGAEHASEILKSSVIQPIDDRSEHENLRNSRWFMSIFLRFMLSDGAGAFLLQDRPDSEKLSLRVNWTHSMSFAHEAPLCMKLEGRTALLSQDLSVLSSYLVPLASKFLKIALETQRDSLDSYSKILPHMSSYFFRRKMERVIASHSSNPQNPVPYWTNLATAGNTGSASIYVMLDQFLRQHELLDGDRILLFIPESGQFNFVLVSLTVVLP
ncbi:beta-ketoacyl synthase N-terminal-like domain-containing protein [Gimesia maris]|uniref:beta-ketoacyl synthase N-terminal-like domain-containing protein n=1 Tax=Gimesia maris TaxID=122 RepID=UPI0030D8209A|tara:strand:- start:2326 stop:3414 length:1089 start_codon:yes stop_codon:yes gene_type:complete